MREVIVAIDPMGCGMARHVEREEIVRCRDCYYATPYQNDETIYICRQWDNETVPSDGYCHMGERRGE